MQQLKTNQNKLRTNLKAVSILLVKPNYNVRKDLQGFD